MSLNRRMFQWLLNINGEGNPIVVLNSSISIDEQEEELNPSESYFFMYSREPLTAAVILLFQNVVENVQENMTQKNLTTKSKSVHLKAFRILISLLDKPEVGSAILDGVMLEVFRTLYKHSLIKKRLIESDTRFEIDIVKIHDEVVKNANLLFNSLEPFFMWEFLGKVIKRCNESTDGADDDDDGTDKRLSALVEVKSPTYAEIFILTTYLLDIVSLVITIFHLK